MAINWKSRPTNSSEPSLDAPVTVVAEALLFSPFLIINRLPLYNPGRQFPPRREGDRPITCQILTGRPARDAWPGSGQ